LAQEEALRYGITSIQGGPIRGEDEVRIVEEAYQHGELHLRYSMWGDLERPQEFLALQERHKNLPEEWVRFETLKGFVDGVLSTRTAALLEPYSDATKTRGEPQYTQDKLNELVLNANRLGLPVALHTVGDRAAAMGMTAFSTAKKLLFNSRVRNRMEHLEVVPQFIYDKFWQNGVIASVQPSHMVYETEAQNYNESRLGRERSKQAFAWKRFETAKVHIAFGSDWPVAPLNPMIGLSAAVFRQNLNGKPVMGWQPSLKISMEQALEAYAMGGAYATREDHVKGSLREGKYADLVILEQSPFKVSNKDLLKIPVSMTIVGGKVVYDNSGPQLRAQH
jgi:predicted amidohydrolase YtcJ